MGQLKITCKSCGKSFLAPPVDTGRQEISQDIDQDASFALICPFCMAHAVYTANDLEWLLFRSLFTDEKNYLVNETNCVLCGAAINSFKYRPMESWNINGLLCGKCYDKMLLEHYIQPDRRSITKK